MRRKRPSPWESGWTAARLAGRRVLGRAVTPRDTQLADLLTDQLDKMKGLPMKLGQIVSYMDVPLPDEVLTRLSSLQTGEQGLDPDETRAALEAALQAPVESRFDAFEFVPLAAASIGQVHAASAGGRRLAVKIQYPGIAETFRDDLALVNRIASLASLASAVDGKAIVRELQHRLIEECDYGREAQMQRTFAAAFAQDTSVKIPRVVTALSTETVLTSEWVEGHSFERLRASGNRVAINAAAEVLVRFSYRSLLNLALIQADPHPGNFIFGDAGEVTFIDFGCVRHLDVDFVNALRSSIRAVRDADMPRFRSAVTDLGLVGRPKKFDFEHFFRAMEHLYRPLISPHFHFSTAYAAEAMQYNGPSNPNARNLSIPPPYVWVMRLQWGLWSILGKLQAEGSYRPLLDLLLAQPVEPPALAPQKEG